MDGTMGLILTVANCEKYNEKEGIWQIMIFP